MCGRIEPGTVGAGKRILSVDCDECGFDYETVTAASVPGRLREGGRGVAAALHGDVRVHPDEGVWSQLEYACHVRDVLVAQRDRLELALREVRPAVPSMQREERVERDEYNEQDPDEVARALVVAADALADYLEAMTPDEQARTLIYGYPVRAERTLVWVGIHTVHELVHHALDISRQ
jgi:S-DNA-T family DNA segregation ATPase FtsK/SpoIIIE